MEETTIRYLSEQLREIRKINARILSYIEREAVSIPLTAKQAAVYLGVSSSTITNYRSRGLIKPVYRNGLRGYDRVELDKLRK